MRAVIVVATMALLLGMANRTWAEPATKPEAGADSPRQALKDQDAAARSGNVDADMSFYQAEGDQQQKLARAIAEGDVAVSRLQKSVESHFGKELATAVVRASGNQDVAAVEAASEKVEGDHATIQFASPALAIPMVRQDGKWKVSLSAWLKDTKPQQVDQLIASLQKLTGELNQLNDLVEHDKFRSGEGVRDRVQAVHDQIFGAGA